MQEENLIFSPIIKTIPMFFDKEQSVRPLLGVSKRARKPGEEHMYIRKSEKTINITKINTILIECNIVAGSYINNVSASVFAQRKPWL